MLVQDDRLLPRKPRLTATVWSLGHRWGGWNPGFVPGLESLVPHRSWRLAEERRSFVYDLTSRLIVPRPIAFISTVSPDGVPNLAPFSFFMLGGVNPPSLAFCPVRDKDGNKKTTLVNVEQTREFTVNLVTRQMAEGMNQTGVDYPEAPSKWGLSGFIHEVSQEVRPDRVSQSPVQFECRVHDCIEHGTGPGASTYVVGEILVAHVDEGLFDPASNEWTQFLPIARLGGSEYIDLDGGKVFEMARPNGPAKPSVEL